MCSRLRRLSVLLLIVAFADLESVGTPGPGWIWRIRLSLVQMAKFLKILAVAVLVFGQCFPAFAELAGANSPERAEMSYNGAREPSRSPFQAH